MENSKGDIDQRDDMGWTALHCACSSGSDAIVELLIQHHADVNIKTDNGQVPLHYVASKNYTRKSQSLKS